MTYVIKQGDTDLFAIDPRSGILKTIRGLDYERESQHVLIIGTLENTSDLAGATTRVVVNVQDVNDIPPVFTTVPRPIKLEDNVPIGATVVNLIATDSDGTAPGNQVRYIIIFFIFLYHKECIYSVLNDEMYKILRNCVVCHNVEIFVK